MDELRQVEEHLEHLQPALGHQDRNEGLRATARG